MIGSTNLKVIHNSNLQIKQYRNSTNSEFGLLIMWATNEKVEIIVTSSKSKIIYKNMGNSKQDCRFGNKFLSDIYFFEVI